MQPRHLATLFALSLVWGCSFLFIRVQLDAGFEPLGIAALRTALGALALLPLVMASRGRLPRSRGRWLAIAGLGAANFALPWSLVAVAEHHISTGMASIANSTAPLWAAILALAFLREERLTPGRALGLLVGFAGIVILAGPANLVHLTGEALGVALVLLSTLSYAAAAVVIRRTMGAIEPLHLAAGQLAAAAVILLPLALGTGAFRSAEWQPAALGSALALGLLGSGLAVVLYTALIQQIGAVRSTLVTYLIPPWGVLLGWAILEEPLGWNLLAGAAVTLVGLALVQGLPAAIADRRRPPTAVSVAGAE
ncbi:DMT family transporter [Tepidiforma sp.]|uniref:DMT family transporter n=1 Tax=Tepidiforma sp. TaxID=2682230 RepID=UPI002ADE030B|nr:DMT family transporter [Tepidiforma sp.]